MTPFQNVDLFSKFLPILKKWTHSQILVHFKNVGTLSDGILDQGKFELIKACSLAIFKNSTIPKLSQCFSLVKAESMGKNTVMLDGLGVESEPQPLFVD